jgi:hypothetical protein
MPKSLSDPDEKLSMASWLLIASIFAVAGLLLINSDYFPKSRTLTGVVRNTVMTAAGLGNGRGVNQEHASVKLQNGQVVLARVSTNNNLQPGEVVGVLEQQRFVGPSRFQVIAPSKQ